MWDILYFNIIIRIYKVIFIWRDELYMCRAQRFWKKNTPQNISNKTVFLLSQAAGWCSPYIIWPSAMQNLLLSIPSILGKKPTTPHPQPRAILVNKILWMEYYRLLQQMSFGTVKYTRNWLPKQYRTSVHRAHAVILPGKTKQWPHSAPQELQLGGNN